MENNLDVSVLTATESFRVSIDSVWNVERISKVLNSVNVFYCISILAYVKSEDFAVITGFNNKEELAEVFLKNYEVINQEIYKKENGRLAEYFRGIDSRSVLAQNLRIVSIQYNSPGKIDLLGIGKVVEIFSKIFQYYFPNKKDKILYEIEKQKLFDMRIESLKKLDLSPNEIKKILLLDNNAEKLIAKVIKEDLITGIELLENK